MDLTSWWPRPKSEDTIAELTRLQESRAASAPDAEGGALPAGVRSGGAFPPADGPGYEPAEVDAFLARVDSMSCEDIGRICFGTTERRGYDIDAVDDAVQRLRREAQAAGR